MYIDDRSSVVMVAGLINYFPYIVYGKYLKQKYIYIYMLIW